MCKLVILMVLMVSVGLLGCGSSGSEELGTEIDCDWFAGPNCWKDLLSTTTACGLDPQESGVLSAGGSSCTYADGSIITFHNPIDFAVIDDFDADYYFDFTIETNGSTCLSYSESNASTSLSVGEQVFSAQASSGMLMTCPSGEQYRFPSLLGLMGCDWDSLPGVGYSWVVDQSITLSFNGGAAGAVPVFNCEVQ